MVSRQNRDIKNPTNERKKIELNEYIQNFRPMADHLSRQQNNKNKINSLEKFYGI